jgi:aminoacylase
LWYLSDGAGYAVTVFNFSSLSFWQICLVEIWVQMLQDADGNIFARGSQDMKCVSMQYLEAIRNLKSKNFQPLRNLHLSFVPEEEVGGDDGAAKFVSSPEFQKLNVGFNLDEGLASPGSAYRVFNGERSPWWLKIKATGAPGHGSKLYDGSAFQNLLQSIELINKFREEQFNLVKSGAKAEGEVTSVNGVYLKAGTPTPTVPLFPVVFSW